jgi:hypothetical protein
MPMKHDQRHHCPGVGACPFRVLTRTDLDKSPGQRAKIVVEVAGIEPASFSLSPSILRAQPVIFLGLLLATGVGRKLELAKFSLRTASAVAR